MDKSLTFVPLLIFLLIGSGCNNDTKFDKVKWLQLDDMEYPYRKAMLNDLTNNYKIKGLPYKQIIDLLGHEQENLIGDSSEIIYPIFTDYGSDIDPIHTITLAIKLNKDSVVTNFKIDEWKK